MLHKRQSLFRPPRADDYFSASLIVSVTDKISNAFENAANLTINFLGQMTAPFTITTANDLEKEGLDVVLNPGIVLSTAPLAMPMVP